MKLLILLMAAIWAVLLGFIPGKLGQSDDQRYEEFSIEKVRYCSPSFDPSVARKGKAPLLKGLGRFRYIITTSSPKAQLYFSQGLALTYGFNHAEAARSFQTAVDIDSTCAMGYWGLAMVLGPNYNAPLNPTSLEDINAAVDNAVKYSNRVKPHERALINAMSKRFPREEVKDMRPYYEAYAKAMKEVYDQFSNDVDVAALTADALMNLHPWDLWLKDGTAQPWTPEIITLLEKALQQSPKHPGVIHYYIHAIEQSKEADKALSYANTLKDAMPAAGHLVHMPSHIYIRTGDYHEGVLVNEKASLADSTYIAQCKAQGAVPMMYYPHNIHFLAACAFFEGNSKKAIDASWMVSRKADRIALPNDISVQHFFSIPYYVLIHFGKWDDILKMEDPGESLKYPSAIWHYSRGMAFAAKGRLTEAENELKEIKKVASTDDLKTMLIWGMNSALELVNLAAYALEGEILGHKKMYSESVSYFEKAIAIEDRLMYTEPPDWFFSVRQSLGHWLVQSKKFDKAEAVYRQDLELFKENGWSLMGLYNSLIGQGKTAEANEVMKRFENAWKYADVKIKSSRVY